MFVSGLLDAGAETAIVAKMAGHADVQTRERYVRRPEDAKRKAAGALAGPPLGTRKVDWPRSWSMIVVTACSVVTKK
jgi:hypothetical protein